MIKVGRDCYIDKSAVLIGDVEIGDECSVWPNAVLRGDLSPIKIGSGSNVQDCAVLHVTYSCPCIIGKNVTIGHGAVVHGVDIKDNCLIGMNTTVLEGSTVGEGSIIGANGLVTSGSEIPENSLVLGVPGKVVKRDEKLMKMILQNAKEYDELRKRYLGKLN
jgi:carbonic anhydrase/acetyltransferase-like protein (isoleucine patch superfamily)